MEYLPLLLPKLQPMLGVSFALNLAYLGLPRFRYRQIIHEYTENVAFCDDVSLPSDSKGTSWHRSLLWLSGLLDNNELKEIKKKIKADNSKNGKVRPRGVFPWIYQVWYSNDLDRRITILTALLVTSLIILASAQEIGYLMISTPAFRYSYIHPTFWLIVFSSCLPAINVYLGGKIVKWSKDYVDEVIADHTIRDQPKAEDAVISETKPKDPEPQ